MIRLLCVLLLCCPVVADEWTFALSVEPGAERIVPLAGRDLSGVESLRLSWTTREMPPTALAWMEVVLVAQDGRWFVAGSTLPVPGDASGGSATVPLSAGHWGGRDGVLTGDVLRAVREVRVRIHGGSAGRIDGTIVTEAHRAAPALAAEAVTPAMIERCDDGGLGLWREWRVRLVGDARGSTGQLDAVAADGARRPLFLEQPAEVVDGVWRPYGAPQWVLRLRPDETVASPVRLEWHLGAWSWTSAALTLPAAASERMPLLPVPAVAMPVAEAPPWTGRPAVPAGQDFVRSGSIALPSCPAPTLVWRGDVTGFRGPRAVGHLHAAALDRTLITAEELDVLPDWLAREQGRFRFGLAPWHLDLDGPWQYSQDLLDAEAPWDDWRAAARDLVARARAAPHLARWRLGLMATANGDEQLQRLLALERDLAALIASADGRPVLSLHPQVVSYRRPDPAGLWGDFEAGNDGWQSQLGTPFGGGSAKRIRDEASNGSFSLAVPLQTVGDVRVGGVTRLVDANVMNLDRLTVDVRCAGPAGAAAQVYAWCTDRHHRWYQQRLDYLPCAPRWNEVLVDFASDAPWQPVGHQTAWDGTQRRQLRRVGLVFFVHGDATGRTTVAIDRIRRQGWPDEAAPELSFGELRVVEPTTRFAPIAADFSLSVPARNPYDPDVADVVGEVEGPNGQRMTYPAYWAEPFTLHFADGRETAMPNGAGGWCWRFSPPTAGAWRWRITAMIRWRDQSLRAETPWRTTVVPDRLPALQPVRIDERDPTCFARVDGSWWYPIGMNLRSPSDTRQDRVLLQQAKGRQPDLAGDHLTVSTVGWSSDDFERLGTRAYERWFSRMQANGMDWARVWMCPWWCGLEWSRQWDEFGGLTVYNQASATRLDRVMELAAQHGVYVQLELQNHGMTSEYVDKQWDADEIGNPGSPYSVRNGGPCRTAADFYRSPQVWTIHAKRLRYTQARWGHHSHLAAYVLTSEMEFTGDWWSTVSNDPYGGHAPATAAWVKRSLEWFRANDPQQRPVSIHFSHPWRGAQMWREPGLGFSNSNAYTGFQDGMGELGGPGAGLDVALETYLNQHFPPWDLRRPTLIGEWGGHWDRNTAIALNQELHTGLWMQAALPYGGNTGYWWWLLVDVADTWREYAAVRAFALADDPRGRGLRPARPVVSDPGVRAIGMRSDTLHRYYIWVQGLDRTPRPAVANPSVRIDTGQPHSRWTLIRWNCRTGQPRPPETVTANPGGAITVACERLDPDLALTLRRSEGP